MPPLMSPIWPLRRSDTRLEITRELQPLPPNWPFDIFTPFVLATASPRRPWPPRRRYPYDWAVQGV